MWLCWTYMFTMWIAFISESPCIYSNRVVCITILWAFWGPLQLWLQSSHFCTWQTSSFFFSLRPITPCFHWIFIIHTSTLIHSVSRSFVRQSKQFCFRNHETSQRGTVEMLSFSVQIEMFGRSLRILFEWISSNHFNRLHQYVRNLAIVFYLAFYLFISFLHLIW